MKKTNIKIAIIAFICFLNLNSTFAQEYRVSLEINTSEKDKATQEKLLKYLVGGLVSNPKIKIIKNGTYRISAYATMLKTPEGKHYGYNVVIVVTKRTTCTRRNYEKDKREFWPCPVFQAIYHATDKKEGLRDICAAFVSDFKKKHLGLESESKKEPSIWDLYFPKDNQ